ncbi:hypothetical protein [Rhodobacter sp. NSM]
MASPTFVDLPGVPGNVMSSIRLAVSNGVHAAKSLKAVPFPGSAG